MQPSAGSLKTNDESQPAMREAKLERRGPRFTYPSGSRPLDGYTIKRGIGVGGFGEVYFALSDAGKEVALKRIQRNLDIELRGVRQCLNLKHVNLISLWDIRTNHEGESWVVMEYVPGHSLREILEQAPQGLAEEDVKQWFTSIAAGVSYLHDHGIVHRDLKPGNVFYDNDEQVIKIGDYGLSKFISCSRRSGQTESVGTFHYMAPEIGKGVYGKEIDVYALGIMLYEMLSGRLPFDGESSQEIIMKHLTADPDIAIIPGPFQKVIARALMKDPELRYRNVAELCGELPWSDVADHAEAIVNRHTIGPIRSQAGDERPTQVGLSRAVRSSEPAPRELEDLMFLENRPEAGELPEIVFGPLQHHGPESDRAPQAGPQATRREPAALRQSLVSPAAPVAFAGAAMRGTRPEPIARAVRGGVSSVLSWWNNPDLSTPIKVFGAVVTAVILIINSAWLIPVALGLGLLYLMYSFIRSLFLPADHEVVPQLSKRELNQQKLVLARNWLGTRPVSDRFTELLGSWLIAAVSTAILSLLGLAVGQQNFEVPTLDAWALYAWMAITSCLASWGVLAASKSWEHREGDWWLRRLTMVGMGVGTGLASYGLASMLGVSLAETLTYSQASAFPQVDSLPPLVSYLVFFAALFGLPRWAHQADPNRKTRLSLLRVGFCLVCAVIVSHFFDFEPMWHGVIAVVTAVSTQLAAPWLSAKHRDMLFQQHVAV